MEKNFFGNNSGREVLEAPREEQRGGEAVARPAAGEGEPDHAEGRIPREGELREFPPDVFGVYINDIIRICSLADPQPGAHQPQGRQRGLEEATLAVRERVTKTMKGKKRKLYSTTIGA